jgi:hypothetical protein
MATPADQRLLELLDKWLKSLELHIRYARLDSESYWKVQPWPEHQRPSRWIIDLALQKATALRAQIEERIRQGDTKFSDALELMTFLANLIGSEHIERFIPLADPAQERDLKSEAAAAQPEADGAGASGTRQMPRILGEEPIATPAPPRARAPTASPAPAATPTPPPARAPTPPPARAPATSPAPAATAPPAPAAAVSSGSSGATTVTREMPRLTPGKRQGAKAPQGSPDSPTATREMPHPFRSKRTTPAPAGTAQVARTERRGAEHKPAARPRQPARIAAPSDADAARGQVIADAARLVQWGRKWYELAELIARMADRPPLPEVRRILKDNKTAIEKKAGGR